MNMSHRISPDKNKEQRAMLRVVTLLKNSYFACEMREEFLDFGWVLIISRHGLGV